MKSHHYLFKIIPSCEFSGLNILNNKMVLKMSVTQTIYFRDADRYLTGPF